MISELVVDLFAGGGGASTGIEMALGYGTVDVAVNHDAMAIALHEANHPCTVHYVSDVFEVDPREATQGRPVGLLWASPDCTDHSKAKGSAPIRDKRRRALAWVVKRWAGQVRPRVIMLENVEEFIEWGPIVGRPGAYRRDERRKGRTFRRFWRSLVDMGYDVQWKELRACDYGAPTTRRRLFLVARCDGKPITWPRPTHGPKGQKPYRTAAECIDWSIPMCSIFATKAEARAWAKEHGVSTPRRPLASKTLARIAAGVRRFVIEAENPHLVNASDIPFLVPRYGERPGQVPRTLSITEPYPVVVPTANGGSLVTARVEQVATFLARHWGGMVGTTVDRPFPTITTKGSQDQVVAVHLAHFQTREPAGGQGADTPLRTVLTKSKAALVASFLQRYNGQGIGGALNEPSPTVTTKDRLGLVTVAVDGTSYVITDIYMRMLTPRELYRCQGFPEWYEIEQVEDRKLSKTEQVLYVGNSVSPPLAAALAWSNLPEMASGSYFEEFVA